MKDNIQHKPGKIYYSMGEVAEMFDVNSSLIRFWEQKFDILRPHKNKKGNRLFTPEDIENLKIIYHLVKEKGMTLAGAAQRIKQNRQGLERDMEVVERLQKIRSILMEIRQELKEENEPNAITISEVTQESIAVESVSAEVEAGVEVKTERTEVRAKVRTEVVETEIERQGEILIEVETDSFHIDTGKQEYSAMQTEFALGVEPRTEPQARFEFQLEPESEPKPKSVAEVESEVKPEVEPEPEVKPEVEPKPEPVPFVLQTLF